MANYPYTELYFHYHLSHLRRILNVQFSIKNPRLTLTHILVISSGTYLKLALNGNGTITFSMFSCSKQYFVALRHLKWEYVKNDFFFILLSSPFKKYLYKYTICIYTIYKNICTQTKIISNSRSHRNLSEQTSKTVVIKCFKFNTIVN